MRLESSASDILLFGAGGRPCWCHACGLGGCSEQGHLRTTYWISCAVHLCPGEQHLLNLCGKWRPCTRGFSSIPAPPNLTGIMEAPYFHSCKPQAPNWEPPSLPPQKVEEPSSFSSCALIRGSRSRKLDISLLLLISLRLKVFGTQSQKSGWLCHVFHPHAIPTRGQKCYSVGQLPTRAHVPEKANLHSRGRNPLPALTCPAEVSRRSQTNSTLNPPFSLPHKAALQNGSS